LYNYIIFTLVLYYFFISTT